MTVTQSDVQAAMERGADQFGILGRFISWRVETDVLVPFEQVQQIVKDAGLETLAKNLPPVRDKAAMSKALRALERRSLVEEITANDERLVYALVRRERDNFADDIRYHKTYQVTYWRSGSVPEQYRGLQADPELPFTYFSRHGDHLEAARRIQPLIQQYKTSYAARNITEHVFKAAIFEAGAIQWTDQGGFYFLPGDSTELLDRLKAIAAALQAATGKYLVIRAMSVAAVPQERDELGQAAMDALTRELEKVAGDVEQLERRADVVGDGTLKSQDAKIDALLEKAARYASIGTMRIEELATQAATLRSRVLKVRQTPGRGQKERAGRMQASAPVPTPAEGDEERQRRAAREDQPEAPKVTPRTRAARNA